MSPRDGKVALVLAGGGLAGAVYEIGALRAIDDLLVDRTVNDLDILDLAEAFGHYKKILARHGIPISRRLVIMELALIQQSGYDATVIRQVLEAHSGACNRSKRDTPMCQLTPALAELDLALDSIGSE